MRRKKIKDMCARWCNRQNKRKARLLHRSRLHSKYKGKKRRGKKRNLQKRRIRRKRMRNICGKWCDHYH